MAVNKERLTALVAALRSGNYKQGKKALHNTESDTWCCLGVACDVAIMNGLDLESVEIDGLTRYYPGVEVGHKAWEAMTLPQAVKEWYGFEDGNPHLHSEAGNRLSAAEWNDRENATFAEIATLFEQTFGLDGPDD